ncbi:MAG: S8/S53 family peptidase [Salibacteraceae bacterium]
MKLIINLMLVLWAGVSLAQSGYYYNGEKIPLKQVNDQLLVTFHEGVDLEEKIALLNKIPFLESEVSEKNFVTHVDARLKMTRPLSGEELNQVLDVMHENSHVICAHPFFNSEKGNGLQAISDRFAVKLKSPGDYFELTKYARLTNTTIIEQNEYDPNLYYLSASKHAQGNALEMANYFYETNAFDFAEPDFFKFMPMTFCGTDSLFQYQWALRNTGQAFLDSYTGQYVNGTVGADVKACEAWEITKGSPNVKVAILDNGVDTDHPDLQDNMLMGYDATANSPLSTSTVPGGHFGNDAHGTACAGIVAASDNNIGISGIAPNCKIIPIKIFGTDVNNDPNLTQATRNSWVADGINWAWQAQADVLSCSWGITTGQAQVINDAIENALTTGRQGLGCVVLFAVGNHDIGSIAYPASLSTSPTTSNLSNLIAVGASDICDFRKNRLPTACFESGWGSNYGAGLTVVAPGAAITTTDIEGPDGYPLPPQGAFNDDDYTPTFFGTSAACPLAAGIAALMISVNPCLTATDVKQLLALSSDRVGGYCYDTDPNHPHGSWNEEMGHGRVNAYRAVKFAHASSVYQYPNVPMASFNQVGSNNWWNVDNDNCAGLNFVHSGVSIHRVEKTVNFPPTAAPAIVGISNGYSNDNPGGINDGRYWMGYEIISETSAKLYTYVYERLGGAVGPTVWVPTNPANITFDYFVLSEAEQDIYLQNKTETGFASYAAIGEIVAGEDVIVPAQPTGDYVVNNTVNLKAQEKITFEDGVTVVPGSGTFTAYIGSLFICTGPIASEPGGEQEYRIVTTVENETKEESTTPETKGVKKQMDFSLFPNPARNTLHVDFRLEGDGEPGTLTIYNMFGKMERSLLVQDVSQPLAVPLEGLSAGMYMAVFSNAAQNISKKFIKQ